MIQGEAMPCLVLQTHFQSQGSPPKTDFVVTHETFLNQGRMRVSEYPQYYDHKIPASKWTASIFLREDLYFKPWRLGAGLYSLLGMAGMMLYSCHITEWFLSIYILKSRWANGQKGLFQATFHNYSS